jgi:hypothetical protein
VDYPAGDNPRGLLLADLDDDTDLDLLVAHVSANFYAALLNDGSGAFTNAEPVLTSSGNQNVLFFEVNRDGLQEIISRAFNAIREVQFFVNTNSGFAAQSPQNLGDAFGGAHGTRLVGDFNSDGSDDFAASAHVGGPTVIKVIFGTNSGSFTESQITLQRTAAVRENSRWARSRATANRTSSQW